MENKNSYFEITIEIPDDEVENNIYKSKVNNSVDLILDAMKGKEVHRYESDKNLITVFKTATRKRNGQLSKFCTRFLPNEQFYTRGITRIDAQSKVSLLGNTPDYRVVEKPSWENYTGRDIIIFNDRSKWRPWQKELYEKLFNPDESFKEPDPRKIISLVDFEGNSGKSSFFKWLVYNHPSEIGRFGYGTASQLRSSVTKIGSKKLYIIDLARSKSKQDKEEDLLSIIEDLKSGCVIDAMYGAGTVLLMDPPHIVVCANYMFNYKLLSKDRWDTYEITKKYRLEKLNTEKELRHVSIKKHYED